MFRDDPCAKSSIADGGRDSCDELDRAHRDGTEEHFECAVCRGNAVQDAVNRAISASRTRTKCCADPEGVATTLDGRLFDASRNDQAS